MEINSGNVGGRNILSIRLNSLADLLEQKPSEENLYIYNCVAGKKYSLCAPLEFINAKCGEDVINKAVHGDEETLRVLKALKKRLDRNKKEPDHKFTNLQKRRRVRIRKEQGDELDIHSVYQGKLDKAWTTRKHMTIASNIKLYTVMIDVGGLGSVGFESTLWRGAVAYQIVNDLITAGKSVKIIVGAAASEVIVRQTSVIVTTDIVVKNYNEPLSMERLAAMSNIGFHRVFNFMSRCLIEQSICPNFGSTNNYLSENGPIESAGVSQDVSKYIYINRCVSLGDALNNLKEIYNELRK